MRLLLSTCALAISFFCWKKARGGSEISFNLSSFDIQECADFIETVRPESDGRIKLNTGDFMLAKTLEYISLEYACQIAARVEGRSSFARLGLQVHMTAPTIHCGFSGTITLELKNCGRHALMITPNDTCICQLIFEKVSGKPVGPFNSKFFGQTDPIGRQ